MLAALPPRTTLVRLTTDADTAAACSRLLVLYAGKLVADGDPDRVFAELPPEVVQRTGQPLVWRVSAALASHGTGLAPTASIARFAAALQNGVASSRAPEFTTVPAVPRSPAAPEGFVLRARDVHFRYEDAALGFGFGAARRGEEADEALRGVSVALHAGECVAFMGSAGAGKTTLLHLLTGVLRPQSGSLEWSPGWNGMPSLVLQFPERQLFAPTVREDVAYGLRASGVRREEIASRVDAALEEVGLPPGEFALRVPFHLSGGEMRRVALAGALAQGRRALLLDEPTLELDAEGNRSGGEFSTGSAPAGWPVPWRRMRPIS